MLGLQEKEGFKYGWDYQAIDTLVLRKKLTHEQALWLNPYPPSLYITKYSDRDFDRRNYRSPASKGCWRFRLFGKTDRREKSFDNDRQVSDKTFRDDPTFAV
ncbi:MAG: hypothetical protein WBB29_12680 [Geitlerinemataceae cyanobacterium]